LIRKVSIVYVRLLLEGPTPGPTPAPTPGASCVNNEFCQFVYDQTHIGWLAESSYWALVKPLTIALILVLAFIGRLLLHRGIDRIIGRASSEGGTNGSGLLRLRGRISVLPSERREQRTRALGSVLRSIASATVFTIAAMLILGEIGLDLGPLLASAGIAGLAVGFGAQNLVKDFIAGLFMLLEDQYGVGDTVDVGEVTGTVEAVGLRITTLRDGSGVLWYVRNGEIVRVGNKSQGWALIIVDIPVGFVAVDQATQVLRDAAAELAKDPQFADDILAPPEVLGVEQITADGAVLRTTVKTISTAHALVGRELRGRLTDALERAGIAAQLTAGRLYLRPHVQTAPGVGDSGNLDTGAAGPT
jgi:small-conductance mechanosensitive channel